MTNEQQYETGVRAGRSAVRGVIETGYWSWLRSQIALCRQMSATYPYAKGYVYGANEAIEVEFRIDGAQ